MAKKLKVLHVIPDLRKGGAERLAIDICRGLESYFDVECCLVAMKPANQYPEICKDISVRVIPGRVVPSISGKGIYETKDFNEFVNNFKPDVIHSHLFEAEMLVHDRLVENILYVTHLHDNMFQFKKPSAKDLISKKRITEFYERKLILGQYKKCKKKFIAISKDVEDYFIANLPSSLSKQIYKINNGFFFNAFKNEQQRIRCSKPCKLLTIGSLVNKKNQAYLIPLVKDLLGRGNEVELNMLGDGPNMQSLKEQIKLEGLEKNIFMRGNVNNVREYLLASDLYLHPAVYEPFGLAILEAMASGLPCISLNGRGNKDIIQHGINGFIFEKEQKSEFIETIQTLQNNQEYYQSISLESIKRSKEFDMPQYVEKIFKLYTS